jgi:hypothetical protein
MGIVAVLRMETRFWTRKRRGVLKNAHSAVRMAPSWRPTMERLRRGYTAGLVRTPGEPPVILDDLTIPSYLDRRPS